MSWDQLIVGLRWPKCGHAKTAENTQQKNGRQVCRACHRERGREQQRILREQQRERRA